MFRERSVSESCGSAVRELAVPFFTSILWLLSPTNTPLLPFAATIWWYGGTIRIKKYCPYHEGTCHIASYQNNPLKSNNNSLNTPHFIYPTMTVRKEETEPEIPVYTINEVQPQMVQVDAVEEEDVATPIASAVPIPPPPAFKGPETIDVIAPTNMAEGYQLNVDAAGRMLRVQVPPGGVVAGQRFGAIVLQQDGNNNFQNSNMAGSSSAVPDPHMIPRGRWRDDLCDCCRFGCCHPMCCLACWCGPCALGQVRK